MLGLHCELKWRNKNWIFMSPPFLKQVWGNREIYRAVMNRTVPRPETRQDMAGSLSAGDSRTHGSGDSEL